MTKTHPIPENRSDGEVTKSNDTSTVVSRLTDKFSPENFNRWYQEREFRRNIRQGTPFFNGARPITPPERHSPSSLMQCHRKMVYRQLNTPEETEDPNGIFWFGSRFEEDIVMDFLEEAVVDADEYVANSLWVDFSISVGGEEVRIKGETDPVIVTPDSEPLLVTEIKTKESVESVDSPNTHHRAQVHAYMKGLSEKYDQDVSEAIILYGSRTTFDIRVFHIEFDPCFWHETVLEWARTHTSYRLDGKLPPATPEYEWECEFCSYRERCGMGEKEYTDTGPEGLLPLYSEYPRQQLVEYLQAHENAKLTPTLAHKFPKLADRFGVFDWHCSECSDHFDWDSDSIDYWIHTATPPECPSCGQHGNSNWLCGPDPEVQHEIEEDSDES